MKTQISPKVFFAVLAVFLAILGTLLYRQATDPLYHREPDEEAARKQFLKPGPGSAPEARSAPHVAAPKSGAAKPTQAVPSNDASR